MVINTSDINSVKNLFKKFALPQSNSHKGQNGRILIIGGSSLFHAAVLWSAEVASHFADIVHFSSTVENQEIFRSLKKIFRNGMIIQKKELFDYVKEDDVILVGTGMVRDGQEGKYTSEIVESLINKFPEKKFVFDAGALQMMDKNWLLKLKTPAIITPHQIEFAKLFGQDIIDKGIKEKEEIVKETAKKYKTVILLKAVDDIVSDGEKTVFIHGGNQGLTKGGTGDVLAGLTASFYVKNNSLNSAVFASIILKKTSDVLFVSKKYWYNVTDIISKLPEVLSSLI